MAKQLAFAQEARETLSRGVEKIARAVKTTLGPRGRNVVLDKSWGSPTITKDGSTVADDIELKDPYENMAVKTIEEAASRTSEEAGDGTTTSGVLAEAIFREGIKHIAAGRDPMSLCRGIKRAVDAVVENLKRMSKKTRTDEEIAQVATVAANNDPEVGKMITRAMAKVGKDGVITVEEGKGLETTVDVVEGMQFDNGYLSPHFVTDAARMEVVLESPYIIIHEEKLSSAKDLIPFLENIAKTKRPLLIIAEDVEGEALATLVVNKMRGVLSCVAVKAPGYGERRKEMLEDIAILTGGRALFKDLGLKLENISLKDLGQARKVTVTVDDTTIVQGAGSSLRMKARCEQIRREREESTSDYDREKLAERLARLAGGIAQINAGAVTETELKERKSRIEAALNATRAAVEEGILPGGGVALLRSQKVLEKLELPGDQAAGAQIVKVALEIPASQIVTNAGLEGPVVLKKIKEGQGAFGYDVVAEKYCDLIEAGVIDPTKVTRCALQNGASVASLLLTTDCLVSEIPKEGEAPYPGPPGGPPPGGMPPMGPGGMGGMGGMPPI